MYAATVREGDTVKLPSGRLGLVTGYESGGVVGQYLDNGEPWTLNAIYLRFISSRYSGERLEELTDGPESKDE